MRVFSHLTLKPFSLFFFIFFGLMVLAYTQSTYAAPEPIGQMVWVKGSVQAVTATNETRTLQRRSPVYERDTIVTSAAGSGQIVFSDKSMVALRSSTTFKIDQYKFNQSSKNNAYVVSLAKGGFRIITGLISKGNPENYRVRTPVATIGVRGTDFTIFYSRSSGLATSLSKGIIVIVNEAGEIELNEKMNRMYAEISGLRTMPVIKSSPSPTLKGQPQIISSVMSPSSFDGGSSTAPARMNVPSGPSRTVSGFCIN
ncbi:MAG: hypothetical protein ACD_45C00683G0002 [uncultured bacterium]|nr:MAG: hypothetical protein ACD_45C00683G0002 [uncultured bacterium]